MIPYYYQAQVGLQLQIGPHTPELHYPRVTTHPKGSLYVKLNLHWLNSVHSERKKNGTIKVSDERKCFRLSPGDQLRCTRILDNAYPVDEPGHSTEDHRTPLSPIAPEPSQK